MVNIKTIAVLLSIFYFSSCSDDATGPDDGNNNGPPGESVVQVSGAVEGEHSGWALFNESELPFDTYSWGIAMTDNNIFHVDISASSTGDPVNRPDPGTYEIDSGTSTFLGIYTDIETGGIGAGADYEYSTLYEGTGGELVIEESTENFVSGSFEFVAANDVDDEGNLIDVVTVSGEFTAMNQDDVD